MSAKLYIERKTVLDDWEIFAYPKDNVEEAAKDLAYFRELETEKRYPKPLRLVRETREILA